MNENKMPGMPESKPSDMPVTEEHESPVNSEPSDLPEPSELVGEKPQILDPDKDVSNKVNTPMIPKSGIEVIATRRGFFGQMRKREGDKFIIKSEEQFGGWFKCIDPTFELKRKKIVEGKKKRMANR